MNVFAKFDEMPSMILQDIKEIKRYRHTRSVGRTDRQRENSIPTHKHSLQGGIITNSQNTKRTYGQPSLQLFPKGGPSATQTEQK